MSLGSCLGQGWGDEEWDPPTDHITNEWSGEAYIAETMLVKQKNKAAEDEWLRLSETLATSNLPLQTSSSSHSLGSQHSPRRCSLLRACLLLPLCLCFPNMSWCGTHTRDAPNSSRGCHQRRPRGGSMGDCQRHLSRHRWSQDTWQVTNIIYSYSHSVLWLVGSWFMARANIALLVSSWRGKLFWAIPFRQDHHTNALQLGRSLYSLSLPSWGIYTSHHSLHSSFFFILFPVLCFAYMW